MKIDKSTQDDYATLTLKGEFDTFYCPALMQEVEALVERGISLLILDMSRVKFINSTALGAVIKAHKRCRAEGGDLLIAQPSPFVRNVMTNVGIDKLITLFDSEAEATKAIIKQLNQKELVGDAPVDHEKIMITFPDETRNLQIPRQQLVKGAAKVLVAQMANVDATRVQFLWNGSKLGMSNDLGKSLFFLGSDMHLKFQVKMIKRSFFDVDATVGSVEAAGDGLRVTANLKNVSVGDREALSQFAADMEFLKRQLPGKN
jgi:anti-anti-sigma factor